MKGGWSDNPDHLHIPPVQTTSENKCVQISLPGKGFDLMKIKAAKDAEHSLGIRGEVGGEEGGTWQLYQNDTGSP